MGKRDGGEDVLVFEVGGVGGGGETERDKLRGRDTWGIWRFERLEVGGCVWGWGLGRGGVGGRGRGGGGVERGVGL